MKNILPALASLLIFSAAHAQMDDKFYFPSKTMQPIDSVEFEEVTLQTDTVQLNGIFLKPAKKPKATVLFFHGAGGNISKYLFMTKPMVAAGYQVFMIDLRGYGKSTGKPTHLNIAKDAQTVLDYLLTRKDVQKTKLLIYGASIGSQAAVNLTKNNQGKIAALVLDGPISSFTDIAADKSPEAQREMIRKYLPSPYSAKEDIKAITIPKLFIHSKEDQDVPYGEGELVYNNATGQKTFLTYEGKHLEAMKVTPTGVIKEMDKLVKK